MFIMRQSLILKQAFYIRDYLEDYSAIAVSFIGALQISLFYLGGIWIGAVFDSIGLKVSDQRQL